MGIRTRITVRQTKHNSGACEIRAREASELSLRVPLAEAVPSHVAIMLVEFDSEEAPARPLRCEQCRP